MGAGMHSNILQLPMRNPPANRESPYDLRFRALVDAEQWERLPDQVKRRFTKRLIGPTVALYRGLVVEMRVSPIGWMLAQACRMFGSPLPLCHKTGVAALVSVSEDASSGGQCWTRIYSRPRGFPQVIHSAKRFAGPTGLEEYLGRGLGMALRIETLDDGIAFVSDHYFIQVARLRVRLPRWMTPGTTRVIHRQIAGPSFLFELELDHPWAGRLFQQQVLFEDVE
jgi:hypothetical protein